MKTTSILSSGATSIVVLMTMTTTTTTALLMLMFLPSNMNMALAYTPSVPQSIQQHTTTDFDLDSIDAVLAQAQEALKVAEQHGATNDIDDMQFVIEDPTSSSFSEFSFSLPSLIAHGQQRIIPIDLVDMFAKTDNFLKERNIRHNEVEAIDADSEKFSNTKQLGKMVRTMMVNSGRHLWKSTRKFGRTFAQRTIPAIVEQVKSRLSTFVTRINDENKLSSLTIDAKEMAKSIIDKFRSNDRRPFSKLRSFLRLPSKKTQTEVYKSTFAVPTTTTHRFYMTEKKNGPGSETELTSYETSFAPPSSLFLEAVATSNKKKGLVATTAEKFIRLWQLHTFPSAWFASVLEGIHGNDSMWNGTAMVKSARVPGWIGGTGSDSPNSSTTKKAKSSPKPSSGIPFFAARV
jgi:hypothetical protein